MERAWRLPCNRRVRSWIRPTAKRSLDFSAVRRVDTAGLSALEELAAIAEGRGVKLALRGVNSEVYKVLKLAKLGPRFSFLS